MKKTNNTNKAAHSSAARTDGHNYWKWVLPFLILLIVCVYLQKVSSSSKHSEQKAKNSTKSSEPDSTSRSKAALPKQNPGTSNPLTFDHTFDTVTVNGAKRSLLSTGKDSRYLPDTDVNSGRDLWVKDEFGNERLVDRSVYRARFSPDGSKIAYATSDATLRVEDLAGTKLAEVEGAYEPSWKPDSSSLVFSKVPPGLPNHQPGAFQLATLNPTSGEMEILTDGQFDDGRPQYDPTGESVLFVSGGRTGLASFWMINRPGEEPVQLTNLGQSGVGDDFVPTPYSPQTLWSPDRKWFIYDFKHDDVQQVWGLELNPDGTLKRAGKLADGLNPQWKENGKVIVCQNAKGEMVEARLP